MHDPYSMIEVFFYNNYGTFNYNCETKKDINRETNKLQEERQ